MDYYEKISPIGEGTYGVVMKCRHKETGQVVAIKKFKESEDDMHIRKTALREVRMLKQLKNDNIVNLIEVFRRKGKLYLVFEHLDHTILEDLDKFPRGLSDNRETGSVRKCMWQLLKAMDYLHSHNVIHRDIKPENILISSHGVLKLCDFGFARTLAGPGARYTDYVATRWYRAPELLVGDTEYGKAVDLWATGCIFAELLTGQPLFPGDTDIDQLYRIMKCLGQLTKRHMEIFLRNPLFTGVRIPEIGKTTPLEFKLPSVAPDALQWLRQCLIYDPDQRASTKGLMSHPYFQSDGFAERFESELRQMIESERDKDMVERRPRRSKPTHKVGASPADLPRTTASRRTERQPLEDVDSNSKRFSEDDRHAGAIPPIPGAYPKPAYAYSQSTVMIPAYMANQSTHHTGVVAVAAVSGVSGPGGGGSYSTTQGKKKGIVGPGGVSGVGSLTSGTGVGQLTFPKIQMGAGIGYGANGLMRGNMASPASGLSGRTGDFSDRESNADN